jgi:hypothetical protein
MMALQLLSSRTSTILFEHWAAMAMLGEA